MLYLQNENTNDLPEWAREDLIDGNTGVNNVVPASESQKTYGWYPFRKIMVRPVANWLSRQTWLVLKWVVDVFFVEVDAALSTISTDLTSVTDRTGELETNLGNTNNGLSLLTGRVESAEGSIVEHNDRIGATEAAIIDHTERIENLETQMPDHQQGELLASIITNMGGFDNVIQGPGVYTCEPTGEILFTMKMVRLGNVAMLLWDNIDSSGMIRSTHKPFSGNTLTITIENVPDAFLPITATGMVFVSTNTISRVDAPDAHIQYNGSTLSIIVYGNVPASVLVGINKVPIVYTCKGSI